MGGCVGESRATKNRLKPETQTEAKAMDGCPEGRGHISETVAWRAGSAYPARHEYPAGMQCRMIHRADEEYPFLHDTMIACLQGRLLCAWYNCTEDEIAGKTVIRGCWSMDGGNTWSEPEIIAQAQEGSGIHMVPIIFSEEKGEIFAYVTEMSAHDRPVGYGTYRYSGSEWRQIAHSDAPALFNMQPVGTADGGLMSAGRISCRTGELPQIPCVYVSECSAPAKWRAICLPGPWLRGNYTLAIPETTLIADGQRLTAVARNENGAAQVFESEDQGRTWSEPCDAGLPVEPSKMCGGTLKNGVQYLIFNEKTEPRSRNHLVIALRRSSASPFEKVYTIFRGQSEALQAGPMWHYPCAAEENGKLFVSCTVSRPDEVRRHAAVAIIPVESLVI